MPFVIGVDIQRRIGLKIELVDLIHNTESAPAKDTSKSQLCRRENTYGECVPYDLRLQANVEYHLNHLIS